MLKDIMEEAQTNIIKKMVTLPVSFSWAVQGEKT